MTKDEEIQANVLALRLAYFVCNGCPEFREV
jgi:hypothetical protein